MSVMDLQIIICRLYQPISREVDQLACTTQAWLGSDGSAIRDRHSVASERNLIPIVRTGPRENLHS